MNEKLNKKYSKISPTQISKIIDENQFSFLSGPVSFVSFEHEGRKFYFFGDEHFDKVGNCENKYKGEKIPCLSIENHESKKKVCYDFVYFLKKLFEINEEHNEEYIDFYMETPFQRRFMRRGKAEDLDYLASLEKTFKNCFRRSKTKCKFKKTRFHYIDFRLKDPKNITSVNYIPVKFIYSIKKQFERKDTTKSKLYDKIQFYKIFTNRLLKKSINQKLIQSYFSDNFISTLNQVFKKVTKGLTQKKFKTYLRNVKKIFKEASEYYKIRNGKKIHLIQSQLNALEKENVKFKNRKIAPLIKRFVLQNYKNKIDIQSLTKVWKEYIDKFLSNDSYTKQLEEYIVGSFIEMDAHPFDAYLLGRMFRTFQFTKRAEHIPSKVVVVYAGNYHIQNYVNFFTKELGLKPEIATGPINQVLRRCVYSPKMKSEFKSFNK